MTPPRPKTKHRPEHQEPSYNSTYNPPPHIKKISPTKSYFSYPEFRFFYLLTRNVQANLQNLAYAETHQ